MTKKRRSHTKSQFERKFGADFISQCPQAPGIYCFYDDRESIIYIGKAQCLRSRLRQYRDAGVEKKFRKQRQIVKAACRVTYEVCESHLAACLKEAEMIQQYQPQWNVAGAYYFLYPFIGIRRDGNDFLFAYTTFPESIPEFEFHGAFRSRDVTKEGFVALMDLLRYLVRSVSITKVISKREGRPVASLVYRFRQAPIHWGDRWQKFLSGETDQIIEDLFHEILNVPAARQRGRVIQNKFDLVNLFLNKEILALSRARKRSGEQSYPVTQRRRDLLFLQARFSEKID